MSIEETTEKRFESDIVSFFLSPEGGYTRIDDDYDPDLGLYVDTLISFIKETQPREWARFENMNKSNPVRKFCTAFNNACSSDGILHVLRHGFKHRGITFRVCYFKPESSLNKTASLLYEQNNCNIVRQWHYSSENQNSVDMAIALNGIPIFAFELKNQYTGQNVDNSKRQWMYDRSPKEICFQFNMRILAYFCVDLMEVWMTTRLNNKDTFFLPFNQGSAGAGNDGGRGNPPNPDGYPTHYLWEEVFQKDSMMDILQKFIHLQVKEERVVQPGNSERIMRKTMIFPRYHQLDVVRKLISDVRENGVGHNYLIQHSAGSGKSNSIAWTAYRLASLHDEENRPYFRSVIVVTDRTVLDAQLQETISGFEHMEGSIETIGEGKNSKNLRDALNDGARIIVTTLQKFPMIYEEVDKESGRNFAVIVDEAHSSQTGSSAAKLKTALANIEDALKEYAEYEGIAEEEIDIEHDRLIRQMLYHGKHKNLSFFAFTATPKDKTLEMFGTEYEDGSYHPFHIYSMRQAIEEGFILDVLQNYMTYDTCFKIAKNTPDNPDLHVNRASKVIRKYQELHPYNINQKSQIIVETFLSTTRNKINGKGKMMVVTSSRLAAVRYYHEIKRYIEEKGYDLSVLVAFSGSVMDGDEEVTESKLNVRGDGSHISENQTKAEFHENFDALIVAEKYQTGFDEPLLHTMVVDKKLKNVKAVQTLSRLNRTAQGKHDTFVLDFVNKKEDILGAFQPFYQETFLLEEVDTDKIYQVQKELRQFGIYTDADIEKFSNEYFGAGEQDSNAMGRMTSILKDVANRYNQKSENDRYLFRRDIRKLVKWYGYVSQVVRMFDGDLHKENVFCSYLLKIIPPEAKEPIDLEGKLKLEYYKLQKTFEGTIELEEKKGAYEENKKLGPKHGNKKEPLDEIIQKINEKYRGNFTQADIVVLTALREKLIGNEKLASLAKTTDHQIFKESIFPKMFESAAHDSFNESMETFASLFEDSEKYNAMMNALAEALYRDIRKK